MKLFYTLFISLITFSAIAQTGNTSNDTITVNGLERAFDVYVPLSYDGSSSFPVVFNLHGYGSNIFQQTFYGDFRAIADTANFIVCIPQGTLDQTSTTYWNAGFTNSGVDDIAFVESMIDFLLANYTIDGSRIYSTGMSNGGYMSYTLACELEDKITAIASVTGSMVQPQLTTCATSRNVPIMQVHGTADATVPYDGNGGFPGTTGIEELVQYWRDKNGCTSDSIYTDVPNTNTADGCTAERFEWVNCDGNSKVLFYKITGGGHTWPGAFIDIGVTNQDFNASVEIWNFFKQFSHPTFTSIKENELLTDLRITTNPVKETVLITVPENVKITEVQVINLQGQVLKRKINTDQVELVDIQRGIYIARVFTNKGVKSIQFLKE